MPGINLVRFYTPEELARKKELEEQWEKQWAKKEKIFNKLYEQYLIKNNLSKDDDECVLIIQFLIDEEENLSKLEL